MGAEPAPHVAGTRASGRRGAGVARDGLSFGYGHEPVLRDVTLDGPRRRVRGAGRPERIGQVHPPEGPPGGARGRSPAAWSCSVARREMSAIGGEWATSPSDRRCCPKCRPRSRRSWPREGFASEDGGGVSPTSDHAAVGHAIESVGLARARRRVRSTSSRSGSSSARSSPGRSPANRSCSSSTSRSRGWTPSPSAASATRSST